MREELGEVLFAAALLALVATAVWVGGGWEEVRYIPRDGGFAHVKVHGRWWLTEHTRPVGVLPEGWEPE